MLYSKAIICVPLKELLCNNMTFGIYKNNLGQDNPILYIKDQKQNINNFSNSIYTRFGLINIHSTRIVLIAIKIENKSNTKNGFIYFTHLNYHANIGKRFMNSILKNPRLIISFIDENTKSHNGLQTTINQDNSITGIVEKLKTLTPWSEQEYNFCKAKLSEMFISINDVWNLLDIKN